MSFRENLKKIFFFNIGLSIVVVWFNVPSILITGINEFATTAKQIYALTVTEMGTNAPVRKKSTNLLDAREMNHDNINAVRVNCDKTTVTTVDSLKAYYSVIVLKYWLSSSTSLSKEIPQLTSSPRPSHKEITSPTLANQLNTPGVSPTSPTQRNKLDTSCANPTSPTPGNRLNVSGASPRSPQKSSPAPGNRLNASGTSPRSPQKSGNIKQRSNNNIKGRNLMREFGGEGDDGGRLLSVLTSPSKHISLSQSSLLDVSQAILWDVYAKKQLLQESCAFIEQAIRDMVSKHRAETGQLGGSGDNDSGVSLLNTMVGLKRTPSGEYISMNKRHFKKKPHELIPITPPAQKPILSGISCLSGQEKMDEEFVDMDTEVSECTLQCGQVTDQPQTDHCGSTNDNEEPTVVDVSTDTGKAVFTVGGSPPPRTVTDNSSPDVVEQIDKSIDDQTPIITEQNEKSTDNQTPVIAEQNEKPYDNQTPTICEENDPFISKQNDTIADDQNPDITEQSDTPIGDQNPALTEQSYKSADDQNPAITEKSDTLTVDDETKETVGYSNVPDDWFELPIDLK